MAGWSLRKVARIAAPLATFLLTAYFAVSCSLRASAPVVFQLPPSLRDNPELNQMSHFAVSISGGLSDSVSAAAVQGRSRSCLKLQGQVSFPYTLDQLLAGVAISLTPGSYHIAIVAYGDTTSQHSSVSSLFAQNPAAKSFVIAETDFNSTITPSVTLTSTYVKATASDLMTACPVPSGGVQGLAMVSGQPYLMKFNGGDWIGSQPLPPVVNAPGLYVDENGASHLSFVISDGFGGYTVRYGTDASGTFVNDTVFDIGLATPTDVAVATNGSVNVIASETADGTQAQVFSRSGGTWNSGTGVLTSGSLATLSQLHLRTGPSNALFAYGVSAGGIHVANGTGISWSSVTTISTAGAFLCGGGLSHVQGKMDADGYSHLAYRCAGYFGYATNRSGSWQSYTLGPPLVDIVSTTFDIDNVGNLHMLGATTTHIIYLKGLVSAVAFSNPATLHATPSSTTDIRVSALSATELRGYFVASGTLNLLLPFTYFGTTFSTGESIAVSSSLTIPTPLFHY